MVWFPNRQPQMLRTWRLWDQAGAMKGLKVSTAQALAGRSKRSPGDPNKAGRLSLPRGSKYPTCEVPGSKTTPLKVVDERP